jgi:hypothetical protein
MKTFMLASRALGGQAYEDSLEEEKGRGFRGEETFSLLAL